MTFSHLLTIDLEWVLCPGASRCGLDLYTIIQRCKVQNMSLLAKNPNIEKKTDMKGKTANTLH